MDNKYDSIKNNAEACRKEGKRLFLGSDTTPEKRVEGLKLLSQAIRLGDCEAMYIFGKLIIDGHLKTAKGSSSNEALRLLCLSANKGYLPSRILLDSYCNARYKNYVENGIESVNKNRPLTDFQGKRIKINRRGKMMPIDATLEYINGENVLTLTANVLFLDSDGDIPNADVFHKTVLEGFSLWAGEYEVFGGQKLKVVVNLTDEIRFLDSVWVAPMTKTLSEGFLEASNHAIFKAAKERLLSIINGKRSFATIGITRWSVRSLKYIVIQSESGNFDEYEEIKHVAKHEFGHALGLGDLYESRVDGLSGVPEGSFQETDSYYVCNNTYNLVMCDHHGPISNNDIEMVVLAFAQNRLQKYQKGKIRGVVSEALGRGN